MPAEACRNAVNKKTKLPIRKKTEKSGWAVSVCENYRKEVKNDISLTQGGVSLKVGVIGIYAVYLLNGLQKNRPPCNSILARCAKKSTVNFKNVNKSFNLCEFGIRCICSIP